MIQVRLLTSEQKEMLVGISYKPDCLFNPIQDINDNWVISNEEVIHCTNEDFMWVDELPLIDYLPQAQPDILT